MTTTNYTEAIAVLSGAVLSGTMLSFSFITVPIALATTTDSTQLCRQWIRIYNAGFPILPTISIATCILYLFTAVRKYLQNLPWQGYAAAGLITVLMVPFTWVFLVPTNNRLMRLEENANAGFVADLDQVRKLVRFWSKGHFTRALCPLIGAVVGMRALLGQIYGLGGS